MNKGNRKRYKKKRKHKRGLKPMQQKRLRSLRQKGCPKRYKKWRNRRRKKVSVHK